MLYTQKKVSNNRNPRRSYVRVGVRIPAWISCKITTFIWNLQTQFYNLLK